MGAAETSTPPLLAAVALESAGAVMTNNIREALKHRTGTVAIRRFVNAYVQEMEGSDFHHGCPVATVALEACSTSPAIRDVCARVFGTWEDLLTERLERDGVKKREARKLAVVTLSALEGAMILSRARRSTDPLRWVGDHLIAALERAKKRRAADSPPAALERRNREERLAST